MGEANPMAPPTGRGVENQATNGEPALSSRSLDKQALGL
jgi:hypothetical protein